MTEQDLHDYNKWLTEVWSKQHSNIPFMKDAPNAYLKYRTKQLTLNGMIYEIIYKGKVLERLATKEVAEKIAEMYRRGEVWPLRKGWDVKIVERR